MNTEQDRTLHDWLAGRDPGDAPVRLRAAVRDIPMSTRPRTYPGLDVALRHGLRLSTVLRPLIVLVVLLAAVAAIAGALILRPWDPFPPRGFIAYVSSLGSTGASGIRLGLPDGTGSRAVSPGTSNVFDHSPRWSADGRTLAFARNAELDALASCHGVGSIVVYDVATATERVIATDLRPIGVIEWEPSSDRIAFLYPPAACGAPGELGFVNLATGALTAVPLGDGNWRLHRTGATITAVDRTVWEVDTLSGELVVRCQPRDGGFAGHVEVTDRQTNGKIDLGIGWAPAWSPDESAIAFIQVTDDPPGGLEHGAYVVVASVEGWQVRTLAIVIDPDFVRFGDVARLPQVRWTRDGSAIYWLDDAGAHIVEVAGGRSLDLTTLPSTAADLQWQPTPGAD